MKIINKATGEEFDFVDGVSFGEAVSEILNDVENINATYPEEKCIVNKNDLVLA